MKAFNRANVVIVLIATTLASIISFATITTYINQYLNKPVIKIQFCDSKEDLILIKQTSDRNACGKFRLALQIANNSEMTYNNILCEYRNLSIIDSSYYGSRMEFYINDCYTQVYDNVYPDDYPNDNSNDSTDSIYALKKNIPKFFSIEKTTIHPGVLPMKQTFLATIETNYGPIISDQVFGLDDNQEKPSSPPKKNTFKIDKPMPIVEHKLAIRISGDDYPQRIYYLTIYFGRVETLSYYNRPIFEIDTLNNNKLKLIN